MSFKATSASATLDRNKQYFWTMVELGNGLRLYGYVSADAATSVDGSGYIDDEDVIDYLNPGDLVLAYQAGSIADTRDILADLAAGITDLSLHLVLENTGTVVDLSNDLLGATVTYGD
jgi:hypothetical protein